MLELIRWFDTVTETLKELDPTGMIFFNVDLEKARRELVNPTLWIERYEDQRQQRTVD